MLADENIRIDAVGTNCGTGGDDMVSVVEALKRCARMPIVAYANAGMPRMQDGVTVYDETPIDFAEKALRLMAAGASIIGGCCGTTPEHIKQLNTRLGYVE